MISDKKMLYIFILPIFLCLLYLLPIISILLFIMLFPMLESIMKIKPSKKIWFYTGIVFSFVFIMNLLKYPTGDWSWYYNDYLSWEYVSLRQYFQFSHHSVKITEPLYHIFSNVVSNLTGQNIIIFIFLNLFFIYYPIYYIIKKEILDVNHILLCSAIVFTSFFAITFTSSFHLIRQYIAASIFLLSLYKYYKASYNQAVILFVIAFLTHNSILLLGFFSIIIYLIYLTSFFNRFLLFLVPVFVIFMQFFVGYIFVESDVLKNATLDDGNIDNVVIFFDCFLLFSSLFFYLISSKNINKSNFKDYNLLLYISILSSSLIYFVLSLDDFPLLQLRLYFYVEIFRVVLFLCVIKIFYSIFKNDNYNYIIFVIVSIISFVGLFFRVSNTPFIYGDGFFVTFKHSVIEILNSSPYLY